jgi:diacylglycerol kinase (ATP)
MRAKVPRSKNQIDSFRYAIEGIVHVFRTQKHMRFHFIAVVLVLLAGMLCHFDTVEMAILVIATGSVLAAEMVNTAVETTVDLVTEVYHPLAKLAKDIAAGAVLVIAISAALVGFILFFGGRRIMPLHLQVNHNPAPLMALALIVTLIFIFVMIVKVIGGKGEILSGGIVSGHSAIAFYLAVTLIYRTHLDILSIILALGLAILVGQSRVEGKIHTLQEVIIGGLLGICVTATVYYFATGPQ